MHKILGNDFKNMIEDISLKLGDGILTITIIPNILSKFGIKYLFKEPLGVAQTRFLQLQCLLSV